MTPITRTLLTLAMLSLAAGCAASGRKPVIVDLAPYRASPGNGALATASPATVRLQPFLDQRATANAGAVTAAFGVPMGHVRFARHPADVLAEVVVAELQAAGHRIVPESAAIEVGATVREFEAHTDTTPVYWDVPGHVVVSVSIARAGGGSATIDYDVRCTNRTYLYPGAGVIAESMERCLQDFGAQFRGDVRVARLLGAAP